MAPCSIDGCINPAKALGWCSAHYQRNYTYGNPLGGGPLRDMSLTTEDRFWSKVEKTAGCWIWLPPPGPDGYGAFTGDHGRTVRAHRFSYELNVGPIPEGHDIDHTCHNKDLACPGGKTCPHRACVRPSHLAPELPSVNRGGYRWERMRAQA